MTIEICRLVRTPQIRRLIASVVALAALFCSAPASAGMSILYSFKDGEDYGGPAGPLVRDNQGALYGVTAHGGALRGGDVFQLAPPVAPATSWTKTTLYSFAFSPEDLPGSTLAIDSKGALYGVTRLGGSHGFGSVYQLSPPIPPATSWTRTNLYDFEGGDDGAYPHSGLVFDVNGGLYGTTRSGGTKASEGVVFKLTPSNCGAPFSYKVIHTFKWPIAFTNASAALTIDARGTLYGAMQGPNPFDGALFSLTPPVAPATNWTLEVLREGLRFNNIVLDGRGALYGTTRQDGRLYGAAFKLTPPVAPATTWQYATIAIFPYDLDTGMALDSASGALYGTSASRGTGTVGGILFKLTPPVAPSLKWTNATLHDFFRYTDGVDPSRLLIGPNGVLYGTTNTGGAKDRGTVFQFD